MKDKIQLFKEDINNISVPTEKLDTIISNAFQENGGKGKSLFVIKCYIVLVPQPLHLFC